MSDVEPERAQSPHTVTDELAGCTLAQVLRVMMEELSWNKARELCKRGKVRINGALAIDGAVRVAKGDRVEVLLHAPRLRKNVLAEDAVLYLDHDVVVVNKPAGVMSVPYEDGDKDTLVDRVRALLKRKTDAPTELGAVQRLDKDTTGVMVFARNLASKRALQEQFRVHSIERRYLAIAHGVVVAARCETDLIGDRGDGLRGSYGVFRRPKGPLPREAQHAVTHVQPLQALRGATLVECRLETGRQHQIRIHLSESGHPLVGEQVYIRDFNGTQLRAARPMLHAESLGFAHPRSGKPIHVSKPAPEDFAAMLSLLAQ